MRVLLHVLGALSLTSALLLASACSSDGGGASGGQVADSASAENFEEGEPVHGEVYVTWRNLNPAAPPAAMTIVNESSENGQKLRSGRASSSEIRVATDAQMGGLLAELKKLGFFDRATDGLGIDNIPELPGRRGILIVSQDGHSRGLMLTTNMGVGPVPKTYLECKKAFLGAHSLLSGAEVRSAIGAPDESILTAPPPKFHRP